MRARPATAWRSMAGPRGIATLARDRQILHVRPTQELGARIRRWTAGRTIPVVRQRGRTSQAARGTQAFARSKGSSALTRKARPSAGRTGRPSSGGKPGLARAVPSCRPHCASRAPRPETCAATLPGPLRGSSASSRPMFAATGARILGRYRQAVVARMETCAARFTRPITTRGARRIRTARGSPRATSAPSSATIASTRRST
jgi:hypothetical protein